MSPLGRSITPRWSCPRSAAVAPTSTRRESIGAGDDDRDGEPGISIDVSHPRIGSGRVFVRQSAEIAWDGVGPDGRITGSIAYARPSI